MTSLRLFLCLVFFAVLGQRVPAQYQETTLKKPCERRFTVGLNNYEPFAFREKGRLKGLAHDLVVNLKEKTGCQFMESEVARPSAIDQMNRGRIDLLALMVQSKEYEVGGEFLPFYISSREMAVAKKVYSKEKKIEDYVADEKVKFAYMIGNRTVISEAEEKKLLKSSRLIGTPDPEGAYRLLKEGRVQAVLFSALLTSYYFEKMNLRGIAERVVDPSAKIKIGLYVSQRRVSGAEKRMIQEALDDMKKDGSFLFIFSKYMTKDEALRRLNNN